MILPTPTFRRLVTASLVAAAALTTTFTGLRPAAAQGPDMPEADKKALIGYKLTLEKVDKISGVSKKLVEAAKANPDIVKEMQAIDAEKGATLEQVNSTFEKKAPLVVALLKADGIDAHEYILGLMSTMFASMGPTLKASGAGALPDFIPAENVDLAEKNPAKFEEAAKNISALDAVGKPGTP